MVKNILCLLIKVIREDGVKITVEVDNPMHKISSVILSKLEAFTIEDIKQELEKRGEVFKEDFIEEVLVGLIECDLVIMNDKKYSLLIN